MRVGSVSSATVAFIVFSLCAAVTPGHASEGANESWRPISVVDAPPAMTNHTTVWTGTYMIVWGGLDSRFGQGLNTGGRYDPVTDTWLPVTTDGAPSPRWSHAAVWTGTHMLIWGGRSRFSKSVSTYFDDGALYDPETDTWLPITTDGAPIARSEFAYAWTGTELVVTGGLQPPPPGPPPEPFSSTCASSIRGGGRYDPVIDSWTTFGGGPDAHAVSGVWIGDRFFATGGVHIDGPYGFDSNCTSMIVFPQEASLFDPLTDTWTGATDPLLTPGGSGPSLWTGQEVLVMSAGIYTLFPARYDPVVDSWQPMAANPFGFYFRTVWAGDRALFWSGPDRAAAWDPVADAWSPLSPTGAPSGRGGHGMLWTGSELLVWGGNDGTLPNPPALRDGAAYSPGQPDLECRMPTVDNDFGQCSASVPCDAIAICVDGDVPSCADPGPYPVGMSAVAVTCGDQTLSCAVTVVDVDSPSLIVSFQPDELWPPNHRMVQIEAFWTANDNCGPPTVQLTSVTSNEPDNAVGTGDGDTINDVQGTDLDIADSEFSLRAERSGSGTGRTYTAIYIAVDGSGNESSAEALVEVPRDRGGLTEPVGVSVGNNGSGTVVEWSTAPGAQSYNVIRGLLSNITNLESAYDLGAVICIEAGSGNESTAGDEDAVQPGAGEIFFYLVEYDDGQNTSYGTVSAAKPRLPASGNCQ